MNKESPADLAGLFYLPRLFVYHAECGLESVEAETFKIMERRLYRAIMGPAMVASWIAGLLLLYSGGIVLGDNNWIWVKLALVIMLTGCHFALGRYVNQFAQGTVEKSARYFRVLNEVPTLLMLVVVGLVVFKPF